MAACGPHNATNHPGPTLSQGMADAGATMPLANGAPADIGDSADIADIGDSADRRPSVPAGV